MKRITSFLLTLCLLLTAFPIVLPLAAEEALPKDESVTSAATTAADVKKNAYDSLYIGASGEKTALGGSLIGLYTAFTKGESSVTLSDGTTGGIWKNKMDATGATDAVLRDSYAAKDWEWGAEKGIAYRMTGAQWLSGCKAMGLTLPSAWASKSSFTVETAFCPDGLIQTDSKLAVRYSAIRLDHLLGLWLPATNSLTNAQNEIYCFRWSCGIVQDWNNTFLNGGVNPGSDLTLQKGYRSNFNAPLATVMRFYKTTDASHVNYGLQYHDGTTFLSNGYTVESYNAATGANAMPVFSLFNGMPGEVYAVRVYDAALTDAEFAHNTCVDLLAYAGADLTEYLALSAANRAVVDAYMAGQGFAEGKNAILDRYMGIISAYTCDTVTADTTYYVTNGLTLLLASYRGLDSGFFNETASKGIWFNALNRDNVATLKGAGWYKNAENGGLTVERTSAEYASDNTFGVYLPTELLPVEDYTLELVANPVGITTFDENGERVRYIDSVTQHGTYNTMGGFAVGALRCLQFACYRPDGKDGQMERRWYYSHDKNLAGLNWNFKLSDITWQGLAYDAVVSYGITHDYEASASSYALFSNTDHIGALDIGSDEYKTPAEAGNKFWVMVGMAGTVFSVRVYDRVLTEAEMTRNRAADLIYFYDPDTSLLDAYRNAGFDDGALFAAIAELDFHMNDEEAQRAFDAAVVSAWLRYEGVGIRKDGTDSVRYYFAVNEEVVSNLSSSGYAVELGAIANVDKASAPLISSCDYKVVAYANGAKNSGFYTDDDSFALTVRYRDVVKDTALTEVLVLGYLRIVDSSGEETVMYLPVDTETFQPRSLFDVYSEMQDKEQVKDHSALLTRVDSVVLNSYERLTVHLQAGAPAGGDGSVSAPYRSFAEAFAACKAIMAKVNTPTKLNLLLGDGEYGVYGTASLSAEEMPYRHLHFAVSSETGNAVFTTTKSIDASDFVNEGNGIWSYRFEKDENGEYPAFRYLYVNGKIQDYSYVGTRHAREENTYQSPYDRKYDAVYEAVKDLYDAGALTLDAVGSYPSDRTDLHELFAYYKICFLALRDEKSLYNAGGLTLDTVAAAIPAGISDADKALYLEKFEEYKLTDLAIDDMVAQYNALPGEKKNNEGLSTLSPSLYTDQKAYTDAFAALRAEIFTDRKAHAITNYRASVKTTAEENAKVYLPLALLDKAYFTAVMNERKSLIAPRAESLIADARAALTDAEQAKTAADALLAEKKNAVTAAYNAYTAASYEERDAKLLLYRLAVSQQEHANANVKEATAALTAARSALAEAEERAARMTDENTWIRYALEGTGLEIHWSGQWWYNILDIAGIDYDDLDASGKNVACYLDPDEYKMFFVHEGYTMENRNICVKGSLSFVDSENEFFYDEEAGKVYTYQPDGVSGKTFSYPTNDRMFLLTEVKNVTFDSVIFTGVDDYYMSKNACCLSLSGVESKNDGYISERSAIRLYSCFGLKLVNCAFRELGCKGLHGTGKLENILVDSCTFERINANAIYLGEGGKESVRVKASHYVENITLNNNYVHQIGLEYHSASAIWINLAKDVTVTNNTVDDCAYTAISVGYTFGDPSWYAGTADQYHIYNTRVAYNYVTNFMTEIGDGGAIYVTGGNSHMDDTRYFNDMHDNYIVMSNLSGDGLGHMICGIYFDGSSSNWYCYDNVIAGQSYGAFAGENDEGYKAGDKYVTQLRNRRAGTTYIYIQHIESQETHNILCEGNYVLNIRATSLADQKREVYKTYVVAERNLVERNTYYMRGVSYIPAAAQYIAKNAGAVGHKGTTDILKNNDY